MRIVVVVVGFVGLMECSKRFGIGVVGSVVGVVVGVAVGIVGPLGIELGIVGFVD